MTDIAVFVSGGGSNMQALLDTIEAGKIKGRVRLVLSSGDKAYALPVSYTHLTLPTT